MRKRTPIEDAAVVRVVEAQAELVREGRCIVKYKAGMFSMDHYKVKRWAVDNFASALNELELAEQELERIRSVKQIMREV